MTFDINKIQGPANELFATRIAWAGERYADIAEGIISPKDGWVIWQWVLGWGDLCSIEDRAGYVEMASRISDLIKSMEEK